MRNGRVVVLGNGGISTRIVFNALRTRFADVCAIIERPPSPAELVRRRIRRLGVKRVVGQLLFSALVDRPLRQLSRHRTAEIMLEHGLDDSPIQPLARVDSVNSAAMRKCLRDVAPAVVVLCGTRIVGANTLHCTDATFLNMHAGLTPAYRGVHGAYWALFDGKPSEVGTTIHLVDEGIDTGSHVSLARFEIGPEDNFATYPLLHIAAGLPHLLSAVAAALEGRLRTAVGDPSMASRLRYHPTLWQYLAARLRRGVR